MTETEGHIPASLGTAGAADPEPDGELFLLPSPAFWRDEAPRAPVSRYLAFDLGAGTYALPLPQVREVVGLPAISPVPNSPSWLLGAASLRGDIISVVDLAAFFGLETNRSSREARLLACRNGNMEVGFVVDRLREIRELSDLAMRPASGPLPGRVESYLAGVHAGEGRLTFILDVPRLLHSPELRVA